MYKRQPGTARTVKVTVNTPSNVDFKGGSFNVVFTENESKKILAEADLNL